MVAGVGLAGELVNTRTLNCRGYGTPDWPKGAHPPPSEDEREVLHSMNLARIESVAVRQAYKYLVEAANELPEFCCFPRQKDYFVDFRYYAHGRWPYAFIINAHSLLCYFRSPCFEPPFSQTETKIRQLFPDVAERRTGELKVRILDRNDAELVHQMIRS